jgi:hypothetical protein
MQKGRLEAFRDGVIAVIITIMVLEMRAPPGADFAALAPTLPFSTWSLASPIPIRGKPRIRVTISLAFIVANPPIKSSFAL